MSMQSVHTNSLGLRGPVLGLGLMGLSHEVYGAVPSDEERFALLDRAYELGITFWDSAELVERSLVRVFLKC